MKVQVNENTIVFYPIKHFWTYMRKYKLSIGWKIYIDGQTDGVFFYMNDGKQFNLSYQDIFNIERGNTVTKEVR